MTVVAVALGVAHVAGLLGLVNYLAVLGGEGTGMIEPLIGKVFSFRIVTVSTHAIILAFFPWMFQRRSVTGLHGRAGKQTSRTKKHTHDENNVLPCHILPRLAVP